MSLPLGSLWTPTPPRQSPPPPPAFTAPHAALGIGTTTSFLCFLHQPRAPAGALFSNPCHPETAPDTEVEVALAPGGTTECQPRVGPGTSESRKANQLSLTREATGPLWALISSVTSSLTCQPGPHLPTQEPTQPRPPPSSILGGVLLLGGRWGVWSHGRPSLPAPPHIPGVAGWLQRAGRGLPPTVRGRGRGEPAHGPWAPVLS